MNALLTTVKMEARLVLREPLNVFFAFVFPSLLLTVLALVPALREPSPEFGGVRFIDYFAPSLLVLIVAMVALQVVPAVLAGYREQGVLRRLSVTPVSPATVLIAQLLVNLALAVVSSAVLVVLGRIAFGIPLPRHLLGFLAAFLVGVAALLAIGTLLAAIAPTTRAATALGMIGFVVVLFLGGVYLPRVLLPDAIARLGAYAPPGVQAVFDGWLGTAPPDPVHLLVMAGIAVVAAAAAARLFRWE